MDRSNRVAVLGVFVADVAFRTDRTPNPGETVIGKSFTLGPGGKGSNQAVAASRLEADVAFISKIGDDAFGDMAFHTWERFGVLPAVLRDAGAATGAACILVDDATGENAIIVCPGAAGAMTAADVDREAEAIRASSVLLTQLEQPLGAAARALAIARASGAATILNPAPAAPLRDDLLSLCDFVTPNESEAEALTGMPVGSPAEARAAAEALIARGAGAAVITLGGLGALYARKGEEVMVPAFEVGEAVDTTGAGDAFNGAFAVALSRGLAPEEAVRFGCAAAGISVTRPGTALSMPSLDEVEALLRL